MQHSSNKKPAFATLFSVVILGLITITLVVTMMTMAIDSGKLNTAVRSGVLARTLAHSCGEIALNKLKLNLTYSGNESFTFETGSCRVESVTGTGNTNRLIRTSGTVSSGAGDVYTRKLEISVTTVNPTSVINYWQEKVF